MTPVNDNTESSSGSMAGLRIRYARFMAEAEAAEDDFQRGMALFAAESTAMTAEKIWGEAI